MCSSHPRVSHGGRQGWGSLSPVSRPLGSPQSSLRTLPCPQAGPGILSSPNIWPRPSYQVGSLSETRMSGSEDQPGVLIPHRDLPGLKVGAVTCGVPSDWGPGSPESSVSVFPLTSWRTCTLPSVHMRLHPLSQVPTHSETLMQKSGHPVKCSSHRQGCPGWQQRRGTVGSPVFSLWVLILSSGRSWDAEVLGRDQTLTPRASLP